MNRILHLRLDRPDSYTVNITHGDYTGDKELLTWIHCNYSVIETIRERWFSYPNANMIPAGGSRLDDWLYAFKSTCLSIFREVCEPHGIEVEFL